jgi:hypothetical protein
MFFPQNNNNWRSTLTRQHLEEGEESKSFMKKLTIRSLIYTLTL